MSAVLSFPAMPASARVVRSSTWSFTRKLVVAAGVCSVLSLAVTGSVVGWRSSQDAETAAREHVRSTAAYAAQGVQADLSGGFKAIEAAAAMLEVAKAEGAPPSRAQLDIMLKRMLEHDSSRLGVYSLWEPNALDGHDAEFVGKGPQHDDTGRFVSYWNRGGGGITVEPLIDYEKAGANDWYDIPRRTGKPALIEPYVYKVGGKDMLITSLVTPIRPGDRFAGIVGIDLLLDGIQARLARIPTLPGAQVQLVSAGGRYVSHPDGQRIAQPADDLSPEALAAVAAGRPHEYTDAQGIVRVLTPVQAAPGVPPWAVCVRYAVAVAKAPAHATMWLTALTAGVCAVLGLLALWLVLRRVTAPLHALADTMADLAGGQSNLRVSLPVQGDDELARIAGSFNQFVAKLRAAFEAVQDAGRAIDGAADEIAAGNADLSVRTDQQTSQLVDMAGAMTQLTQGVHQTAQTAQQADAIARGASQTAQRSQQVMHEAVSAMEEVGASSRRIAEITAVIDGIAFQTNILALNAAVEAARAGEQGRGFSVVAGEVRTLAQRAALAARDIKGLIDESVQRVELGSERIRESGRTVAELVSAVSETGELIATISHASHEQSTGIAHVETALTELDAMTQQNAALVEESAAAAAAMRQQARQLSGTLAAFI